MTRECFVQDGIQLLGRIQIPAERFFHEDAGGAHVAEFAESLRNRAEEIGGNRKIVERAAGLAERFAQKLKCVRILIIAVDVLQQLYELAVGRLVEVAAIGQTVTHAVSHLLDCPAGFGDADNREAEIVAEDHFLQSGEDLLVSEITGGSKNTNASKGGAADRGCGGCR